MLVLSRYTIDMVKYEVFLKPYSSRILTGISVGIVKIIILIVRIEDDIDAGLYKYSNSHWSLVNR